MEPCGLRGVQSPFGRTSLAGKRKGGITNLRGFAGGSGTRAGVRAAPTEHEGLRCGEAFGEAFGEALGDLDAEVASVCVRELTLCALGVREDLAPISGPSTWLSSRELEVSSSPLCSKVTASGSACSICRCSGGILQGRPNLELPSG
mmetsp:Transcript_72275/g.159628  ORF Transcript_72275/g.159628 Transcript_72275/m.159628 type:complete len:147 (-) Transcript_72275:1073-1513(-)